MAFDTDTIEPEIGEVPPQTPPDTTADAKLRLLHTAVGKEYNLGSFDEFKQKIQDPVKRQKLYDAVGKEYNLGTYDEFQNKLGFGKKPQATAPAAQPTPEHEITHTPLQDIRHVQEMANLPLEMHVVDPQGGLQEATPESLARNKAYNAQFDKLSDDLGTQWGTKPNVVKQVLQDFPDEQDESKLQKNAALATENPVSYSRLKNGDEIRMKIAKDGPSGIHDANIFNHLLDAQDYHQLTELNLPYQIQLMREHNLSQGDIDKLKDTQRSLINSMDDGLLGKYWNSKDKEYGLTPDEYAGLETERLFNPNKAQMDEAIIKESRGIGEDGKANPVDVSTRSYAYQRGLENVKYNLQQTGRENLARYVAEHKADTDKQAQALSEQYKQSLQFANPAEQNQLIQDFNNHPVIQEANKLQEASEALKYSEAEDYRRYPLNFADQATRAVADAMDHTSGLGKDALKLGGTFLQGAGETADNTMRFIKNTAINLLASDERRALNSAQNIGHQSLTELANYEPTSYTGKESPILVPRGTQQAVQDILSGPGSDADKQQRAISYIRDNFDQLTVNPKAGQQNLTGKAALFQAANMMGQIAGVANQSFLLGGAIGDASKLRELTTAFTPMFASTQNQMYEQALKNGDEHPLLKSTVDATILSLASLINPDIKVVKGMVGAETGLGKTIAGISEDTWNKVLSENKPVLDRLSGFAKATGRQLGLANLQYGIVAPLAQGIANKALFNEDANLPDLIKDGIVQTNISMALPALLHGVWGGLRATEVNPQQKYSIVEAGLHPDQNIDLIDDKIKSGAISEVQGHEMKQLVKHAGEILLNTEMVKTDGTPMNEKEVADVTYNMLRLRVLEGKLKTAAEPVKPIINEKIHEINKDIADLHTSESDKQRNELNQLLHDNLDKIKNKVPEFEQTVKDAIAANTPEEAFRVIADEANKTKKVEGKETSLRADAEEKYGKPLVEKAIELSKQKPTEKAPTEAEKPKTGDVTDQKAALTIKPTSDKIQPTDQFRTWDLGDMEGKPEDAAAKKHIEGVVEAWDKHPAGETGGETFGDFIQRVIPAFDKSLKEDQNNTTIVTHSSVLKAFKVWDEMRRPDVASLSEEQKKQFADAYNKEETHNGDLETFKGANGDLHVIRHGQTEDNAKNNFRSGNTNLTEQGIQDAHNVGQQLAAKTGGDVPKVISSDLPRAIHTSNIITDKLGEGVENTTSNPTKLVDENGEFTPEAKRMADDWIMNATSEQIIGRANEVIGRFKKALEKYNGEGSYRKFIDLQGKADRADFEDGLKYEAEMRRMTDKIPDGEGEIKPEEYYDEQDWKKIKQAANYANPESLKGADISTLYNMVGREITDPRTTNQKSYAPTNLLVLRESYAELKRRGISDDEIIKNSLRERESRGDNMEHLIELAKSNIEKLKPKESSKLITDKLSDNAIPKSTTGEVGAYPNGNEGAGRSGQSEGVGPSQQGQVPPEESSNPQAQPNGGEVPPGKEVNPDELPFGNLPVAIAHELHTKREKADLGLAPTERGEGITLQESIDRGRELLKEGLDIDKIVSDFQKDKKLSSDTMAAVRARYTELASKTDKAYDQFGSDSPEAKAARTEETSFYRNAVKPMQTEWSKIGVAQQGSVDIDTGTVTGMARAFSEIHGKEFSPEQEAKAKELSDKVKSLDKEVERLKDRLDKAFKGKDETKEVGVKEKAQNLAKKIRDNAKLSRPGMFSAATPASLVWDGAVEVVAKSVEAGGAIADAISKGVKYIQKSDWYKNLSSGEQKSAISEFKTWHKETAMTNEEKLADLKKQVTNNIERIKRQIADKERISVQEKKPIHTDEEYRRLKEDEKALQSLLDKYLPEEPVKYADEKELKKREKTLNAQISDLNDQINKGERKRTPSGPEDTDFIKQLKDIKKAKEEQLEEISPKNPDKANLAASLINKTGDKFNSKEAKSIWEHVKDKYMDKETPFPDALKATANDLGLSMQQILHAIATPKGAKEITDEMFKKQYERNKAINYAKRFVKTANQPAAVKFFNSLPSAFFNLKTYGHGTVGNITHAGPNIFRPSVWKAYWPNVMKSFKLAYGTKGGYEKTVAILESSPHFDEWKRADLACDPRKGYDDFEVFGKKQSWLAEAGTRGFTGLKLMRYDMAEMFYNRLSDSEKADPNARKEIAKLVNHATGHSEVKVPKALQVITFAPGLEVSRWQRMITDPAKAINTFTHWNKATPAEQAAAKIVARGAGERLATYTALLAANAGLLSALNSKQQINLTNPTKSDWLKFKAGGKTIDFTGNILSPVRLLSVIGKEAYLTRYGDSKDLRTKPGDKDAATLAQQARYKLSPLGGTVADVATGTDAMGNVLPWAKIKPSTGRYKMTWPDYAWNQMPIPIAAGYNAYQESMRERGVPHSMRDAWFNAALQFTVEGFTGVKMNPDYDLQKGGGTTGGGGAGGYYGR